MAENIQNNNEKKGNKETLLTNLVWKIDDFWARATIATSWNKKLKYLWLLWLWYYTTIEFIAPVFKNLFIIADWWSIGIFYIIVFIISFIIAQIYNSLIKILIYLFK